MNDNDLKWEIKGSRELLHTPVFDVYGQAEISATGIEGDYIAIDAPDWVMVIPEYQGSVVMVRQWRHAAQRLTLEFPGGVIDGGEDPREAALRELGEETGFEVGEMIHLGSVSPNAALFKNSFHIYLARDLKPTGDQKLDDDELLDFSLVPVEEVIGSYGEGELVHALMGTALALYMRYTYNEKTGFGRKVY